MSDALIDAPERVNFYAAAPEAIKAMAAFEASFASMGVDLEPSLTELIRLRASQINGCAYCIDLHAATMRKAGESDRRIHGLIAWRETPFYTPRERAALAWTESLTLISHTRAPDADYAELAAHFDSAGQVAVTLAINAINAWNRLAIGFRKMPG